MKKIYFLAVLFLTSTLMAQTPIITMIMDGDCSGGMPKVLEIYAQGNVDFTNYSLEKSANGGTFGNTFNLSALGILTNEFAYVHATGSSFATEFPNATNVFPTGSSALSFNGDDAIRIMETSSSTVIDQYGVEVDGTGESWEYKDGYGKRIDNTGPDAGFVEANWSFNNGSLDGLGLCQSGTESFESISNAGSYTATSNPTVNSDQSTVSNFLQFVGNPSQEESINVSGINLTADITVTANSGDYEISTTSGGTFTNSVTLTETGGSVSATPVYIRLNGTAVANPSDGDLEITSTGATPVTVNLEGEIKSQDPTVLVSVDTIDTFFSHFVGTPSAADSFKVEGMYLTNDIEVTAPTNFEISKTLDGTYGSGITLIPNGLSKVDPTKVYVRLDGPIKNLNQLGDVTATSTGAEDTMVVVMGETKDYIAYDIGEVTEVNTDGEADSLGVKVLLTGVVHCQNFRSSGYNLALIDGNNDGISLFSFSDINGYTPTEGDELTVKGVIDQYNGLIQLQADSIEVVSSGATLQTPTLVTTLDETTESQVIKMEDLTLVNGEATWPDNGNIDVTDGTSTFSVRVPGVSSLAGTATPIGPFHLTGIGKQYDYNSPYNSGYQIFPCEVEDLCNLDLTTSVTDETITANATGLNYQWIDCSDNAAIAGETGVSYTATVNGDYAVVITDGSCVDTSDCVTIQVSAVSSNELTSVSVYPNPVQNNLTVANSNGNISAIEIVSVAGRVVYSTESVKNIEEINTAAWNSGVYFVNVTTENGSQIVKVVK